MLPEPYRSKAIDERRKANAQWKSNKTAEDLANAISDGFFWKKTQEGDEYWLGIFHRAIAGEFDTMPKEQPAQLSITSSLAIMAPKRKGYTGRDGQHHRADHPMAEGCRGSS